MPATIAPVLFTQWLLTSSWKDWTATASVLPSQLAAGFTSFTALQYLVRVAALGWSARVAAAGLGHGAHRRAPRSRPGV